MNNKNAYEIETSIKLTSYKIKALITNYLLVCTITIIICNIICQLFIH